MDMACLRLLANWLRSLMIGYLYAILCLSGPTSMLASMSKSSSYSCLVIFRDLTEYFVQLEQLPHLPGWLTLSSSHLVNVKPLVR